MQKPRSSYKKNTVVKKKKVCKFSGAAALPIDYKATHILEGSLSPRGRILPRRTTGVCAKKQRMLAKAIKRARHLGLLPYVVI